MTVFFCIQGCNTSSTGTTALNTSSGTAADPTSITSPTPVPGDTVRILNYHNNTSPIATYLQTNGATLEGPSGKGTESYHILMMDDDKISADELKAHSTVADFLARGKGVLIVNATADQRKAM
jgi:hypothetical protein